MPRHDLSPKNCPLAWGDQNLGPSGVHTPNGISVGSGVFAGPPNMDGSIVFTRLCQCSPMWHVLYWAHLSLQPKCYLDQFSQLCTSHGRVSLGMPMQVLFPKNCTFAWCHLEPHGSFCPPESKSETASQVIFAQLTAGCSYTLEWVAPSPSKLPPPIGDLDPHLIHGCLITPESSCQMASQSVELFLHGLLLWQTDRPRYSLLSR